MGGHPMNLILRFLLEICALIAMGLWGWNQSDDWFRLVLALGIPILATVVWGTFAVLKDPSRSGSAPISIPGILRLIIEFVFFGFAIWAIFDLGYTRLSWIIGSVVIIHYLISYDRIMWLLNQKG